MYNMNTKKCNKNIIHNIKHNGQLIKVISVVNVVNEYGE